MLAPTINKSGSREILPLKVFAGSVILLAIIVRLYGLGNESAWIDEAYSINLSSHSVAQVFQGTAADQHPPLYYLLLHFWLVIGNGISHARLLSVLLGVILVLQGMVFGWKISGEHLGIGTGLLLAISPMAVWYSQEARQYMLLACLLTASTYELWQCLQGRSRWFLYWLFSTLALYTQYFTIFILFAHAIITVLWTVRQKNKRLMVPWLISIFGVSLVFLPWASIAVNQFINHTMPWISDPGAGQLRDIMPTLILGNGIQVLPDILRLLIFIFFVALLGWSAYQAKDSSLQTRSGFLFLSLWALIPLLTISGLSIFYPVFQLKQFLIILTPTLMLAVFIALIQKQPWGRILFLGLIIINGFTLSYQQVNLTKDDWRGVASYLKANIKPGDMVYGNPAAISLALNLYWDNALPFEGYPPDYDILTGGWRGEPISAAIIDQQFTSIKRDYSRIWLVEFFPEFWDANQDIEAWLVSHGNEAENLLFGKIRLRLYKLAP